MQAVLKHPVPPDALRTEGKEREKIMHAQPRLPLAVKTSPLSDGSQEIMLPNGHVLLMVQSQVWGGGIITEQRTHSVSPKQGLIAHSIFPITWPL